MHGRSTTTVKNSKRAILTKNPCLGRKKRAFSKRAEKGENRASTFGKGLFAEPKPHFSKIAIYDDFDFYL